MSEQLNPCPFCGGEVTIALGGNEREKWFVTRGFGENKCTCRVFMESKLFSKDDTAEHKAKVKDKLVEAWNRREGMNMIDEKVLIERLEEYVQASDKKYHYLVDNAELNCLYDKSDLEDMRKQTFKETISIVNQLAEEYNNDFCEWNYSCLDEDLIRPFHHKGAVGMYKECLKNNPFCSCCGKKIKVAPYQPKGE